jgi:hypothetical protein
MIRNLILSMSVAILTAVTFPTYLNADGGIKRFLTSLIPASVVFILAFLISFFLKKSFILEEFYGKELNLFKWLGATIIDVIIAMIFVILSAIMVDADSYVGIVFFNIAIGYFLSRNVIFRGAGFAFTRYVYIGKDSILYRLKILLSNFILVLPLITSLYHSSLEIVFLDLLSKIFAVVVFVDIMSIIVNKNKTIDSWFGLKIERK